MATINKLKEIRKDRGIKQKEIADYLGIKVNTYSQYENDVRKPSTDVISKLSKFYGVLSDELLMEPIEDYEKNVDDFYILKQLTGHQFSLIFELNLKYADFSDLVKDDVVKDDEDILFIQSEANHMLSLINRIRDVQVLIADLSDVDQIEGFIIDSLSELKK